MRFRFLKLLRKATGKAKEENVASGPPSPWVRLSGSGAPPLEVRTTYRSGRTRSAGPPFSADLCASSPAARRVPCGEASLQERHTSTGRRDGWFERCRHRSDAFRFPQGDRGVPPHCIGRRQGDVRGPTHGLRRVHLVLPQNAPQVLRLAVQVRLCSIFLSLFSSGADRTILTRYLIGMIYIPTMNAGIVRSGTRK